MLPIKEIWCSEIITPSTINSRQFETCSPWALPTEESRELLRFIQNSLKQYEKNAEKYEKTFKLITIEKTWRSISVENLESEIQNAYKKYHGHISDCIEIAFYFMHRTLQQETSRLEHRFIELSSSSDETHYKKLFNNLNQYAPYKAIGGDLLTTLHESFPLDGITFKSIPYITVYTTNTVDD